MVWYGVGQICYVNLMDGGMVRSNKLRPHTRSLPLGELESLPKLQLLDLRFNEKCKVCIARGRWGGVR